jgi:MFS family permease
VTDRPLRRNRDFLLLQTGQLLSDVGSQSTSIAYPLLVLAVTGSAARAGVVAFARTLAWTLLALPAGVAADRWNRRRLMLAADGVRVLAVGGLAAAVATGGAAFWVITLAAFAEGAGMSLFLAAQAGAMRAVVPARQLPAAMATVTGRRAAVRLAGPPVGGFLFGIGRALPFLFDAVSYAFSIVSLLAMRTPFQQARQADPSPLRSRLAAGFRYLWSRPFLRTCAMLFGLANFTGPAGRWGCCWPSSGPFCWPARSCPRWSAGCSRSGRCCCWSCGPGRAAPCSSSGPTSTCWWRPSCPRPWPSPRPTRWSTARGSP